MVTPLRRPSRSMCSITGCDQKATVRHYCIEHYGVYALGLHDRDQETEDNVTLGLFGDQRSA